MDTFNIEIYERYHSEINSFITHFTNNEARSLEVLNKLKDFIENGSAITGGHVIDNKLASFIWCYERDFGGTRRLHISYFIVHKDYRGQGLSKDLLNFAINRASELNIKLIDLNVEPYNKKAIKVYEHSGFETEKLQMIMEVNKGDNNV